MTTLGIDHSVASKIHSEKKKKPPYLLCSTLCHQACFAMESKAWCGVKCSEEGDKSMLQYIHDEVDVGVEHCLICPTIPMQDTELRSHCPAVQGC
jgi:hypothetical protein